MKKMTRRLLGARYELMFIVEAVVGAIALLLVTQYALETHRQLSQPLEADPLIGAPQSNLLPSKSGMLSTAEDNARNLSISEPTGAIQCATSQLAVQAAMKVATSQVSSGSKRMLEPTSTPTAKDQSAVELPGTPDPNEASDDDLLSFPSEDGNLVLKSEDGTQRGCARICQIDEDGNVVKTFRPDEGVMLELDACYRTEFYFQNTGGQEIEGLYFKADNAGIMFVDDQKISECWMTMQDEDERGFNYDFVLYSEPQIPLVLWSEGSATYKAENSSSAGVERKLSSGAVTRADKGAKLGNLAPGEMILVSNIWKVKVNANEIRQRLQKLELYEKSAKTNQQSDDDPPTPSSVLPGAKKTPELESTSKKRTEEDLAVELYPDPNMIPQSSLPKSAISPRLETTTRSVALGR